MTINSVNTLEIIYFDEADVDLHSALQSCIDLLKEMPGCIGYAINKGISGKATWIICGYWESECHMATHFHSREMTNLVSFLIKAGASLCFTSFKPSF